MGGGQGIIIILNKVYVQIINNNTHGTNIQRIIYTCLATKVVSTWVVGEDGYYVSGSVWQMVNKWTQSTHITIKGQIQKELMGETSHIDWRVSQVD